MTAGPVAQATELQRRRRASELGEQAMATRIVVEQAKGVIAASRKIGVEQAFVFCASTRTTTMRPFSRSPTRF
jgi:AmiR/NasT family two-component response regulator